MTTFVSAKATWVSVAQEVERFADVLGETFLAHAQTSSMLTHLAADDELELGGHASTLDCHYPDDYTLMSSGGPRLTTGPALPARLDEVARGRQSATPTNPQCY